MGLFRVAASKRKSAMSSLAALCSGVAISDMLRNIRTAARHKNVQGKADNPDFMLNFAEYDNDFPSTLRYGINSMTQMKTE